VTSCVQGGRRFGYLFDLGDNWWHLINVEAIEDIVLARKIPRVTRRVGKDRENTP